MNRDAPPAGLCAGTKDPIAERAHALHLAMKHIKIDSTIVTGEIDAILNCLRCTRLRFDLTNVVFHYLF